MGLPISPLCFSVEWRTARRSGCPPTCRKSFTVSERVREPPLVASHKLRLVCGQTVGGSSAAGEAQTDTLTGTLFTAVLLVTLAWNRTAVALPQVFSSRSVRDCRPGRCGRDQGQVYPLRR
jgi:hypothetical protein